LRACSSGGKVPSPAFMRFIAHPFRCAYQGLQIRRRNAPYPAEDNAAGKSGGKRDRSQVFVNEAQVALVVGHADFDFLGKSSAAEQLADRYCRCDL